MRAIDSDHVIARLDEIQPFAGNKAANAAINLAKDVVRNAPTLSPDDLRPVVHCGECSNADKDLPGAIYCTMWDAWEVPEDGFCYKGAKMEVTADA